MFDQETIDRFWEKIRKGDNGSCWPWLRARRNENTYGCFTYKNKRYQAHVFAFMIANNIILSGREIVIRHSCDNKICCNPAHLEDGTQLENVQEAYDRGFSPKNRNTQGKGGTVLTEKEVLRIRELGIYLTYKSIANMPEFKGRIGIPGIGKIIRKDRWTHIKGSLNE